jgi:hypothetical protein
VGHEFGAREKFIVPDVIRMVMSVKKKIDSPVGCQCLQSLLFTGWVHQQGLPVPNQQRIAVGKGWKLTEENFNGPNVPSFDHSSLIFQDRLDAREIRPNIAEEKSPLAPLSQREVGEDLKVIFHVNLKDQVLTEWVKFVNFELEIRQHTR